MNILIKLTSIVALVIAPHIAVTNGGHASSEEVIEDVYLMMEEDFFEQNGNVFLLESNEVSGIVSAEAVRMMLRENRYIIDIDLHLKPADATQLTGVNGDEFIFRGEGVIDDDRSGNYRVDGHFIFGDHGEFPAVFTGKFNDKKQLMGTIKILN